MSFLQPNLVLRGIWRKATYTVLRMIRNDCPNVWLGQRYETRLENVLTLGLMLDSNDQQHVILKELHDNQSFNAEVNALNGYLRDHDSFRQIVNTIPNQKIIIYEYLADNLHNVLYTRPQRKLQEEEVKRVTKVVLKGLVTIHENNLAHTGMPMNINFSS